MFQSKLKIYFLVVVTYVTLVVENAKARPAVVQPTRTNKHALPTEVKIITTDSIFKQRNFTGDTP